jgi:hypothetical protein
VQGIDLPQHVDASFAVWAVLPAAMEGGFNIHINQPVDREVMANAERLTRIWELWVPGRYRSIEISCEGEWAKIRNNRSSRIDLYSGGVDSTFSILRLASRESRAHALTVEGLEYRDKSGSAARFPQLMAKTAPLLEKLNYEQIVVRTDARFDPISLTHGLTLASCAFLLSDLFEEGTIEADRTPAQDMVTFPWGTNHITNDYLAGSDFALRTIGSDASRTEKLAAIAENEIALPFLSFCREPAFLPLNCGRCNKCIRTKMMFAATIGRIPEIFVDDRFDEKLVKALELTGRERTHILDLYRYAKDHGHVDAVPSLLELVEKCRSFGSEKPNLGKFGPDQEEF